MDAAKDYLHGQLLEIRAKLEGVEYLQRLEDQTNVPKEVISVGGSFLLLLLVFLGMTAGTLCNIVGFIYPAYKSFQALEHRVPGDVTQWLIYWVVYAFFSIIEAFAHILVYWIPFYYAFKFAFLLWAMLPQTRGAKFLYEAFLKDFLKENESKFDSAMKEAKGMTGKAVREAKEAVAAVKDTVNKKDE